MSTKSVKSSTKISTIHFTIINIRNSLPNNCNSVIEKNTTKPDYMCNVTHTIFEILTGLVVYDFEIYFIKIEKPFVIQNKNFRFT